MVTQGLSPMDRLVAHIRDSGNVAAGLRTDADLMDSTIDLNDGKPFRSAAVLVPLVARDEPTVLLTKRSSALQKHAGQVAFPGGTIDPDDPDAVHAALRETEEEVGITRDQVSVLGRLDTYRTGTGFEITPVIGYLPDTIEPVAEPGEVDEIFELPLAFIMDRNNHQRQSAVWRGIRRHYYVMPYGQHYVWGATAAMLVNLCDLLEPVWPR